MFLHSFFTIKNNYVSIGLVFVLLFFSSNANSQYQGRYSLRGLMSAIELVNSTSVKGISVDFGIDKKEWIDTISSLSNLEYLTVSVTRLDHDDTVALKEFIENLREEIFNCTKLKSLTISADSIDVLPELFSACQGILELNIIGNYIGEIPASIGNLKKLERISFRIKTLNYFPKNLSALSTIKRANLSIDKMNSGFPKSIGALVNLEELVVSSDFITSLPNIWGELNQLKDLRIYAKGLKIMEGSVSGLSNLTNLRIEDVYDLERLPDSLGSLPKLEKMSVTSAFKLRYIGNLTEAKSIESLYLTGVNLKLILKAPVAMTKLSYIVVDSKQIGNLSNKELRQLSSAFKKVDIKTRFNWYEGNYITYQNFPLTEKQVKRLRKFVPNAYFSP